MAKLRDLLKEIENPAPTHLDPEIDNEDETLAKVINKHDQDEFEAIPQAFGSLRSRADDKLRDDPRYQGEKVQRSTMMAATSDASDDSDKDGEELAQEEARQMFLEHFKSVQAQENESTDEEDSIDTDLEDEFHLSSTELEHNTQTAKRIVDDLRSDEEEDEEEQETKVPQVELNHETGKQPGTLGQEQLLEDKEKSVAVKRQIDLWDKLLECRIRIQRALLKCNQLPPFNVMPSFQQSGGQEVKSSLSETYSAMIDLLKKLLALQELLVMNNPSTKNLFNEKGNKSKSLDKSGIESDLELDDEDIPSDIGEEGSDDEKGSKGNSGDSSNDESHSEEEAVIAEDMKGGVRKRKHILSLDEYEATIAKRFQSLSAFRDAAIEKWHEKTRLASGKIKSKSFSAFDRSPLVQIKQIMSDKQRLVRRSQLQRNIYRILGNRKEATPDTNGESGKDTADMHLKNYNPEIFDDDDFYHQLLKELIERKSTVSSDDPIGMGRQWLEIQKLRTKVKKKVDTKASKGRKVRYNAHAKLVSFMAPIEACSMSSENRTELFSSLFGKMADYRAER